MCFSKLFFLGGFYDHGKPGKVLENESALSRCLIKVDFKNNILLQSIRKVIEMLPRFTVKP